LYVYENNYDDSLPLNISNTDSKKSNKKEEAYDPEVESREISLFLKTAISTKSKVEMNKEKDFFYL